MPTDRAMRLLLGGAVPATGPRGPVAKPAPSVLVGEVSERGVEYQAGLESLALPAAAVDHISAGANFDRTAPR